MNRRPGSAHRDRRRLPGVATHRHIHAWPFAHAGGAALAAAGQRRGGADRRRGGILGGAHRRDAVPARAHPLPVIPPCLGLPRRLRRLVDYRTGKSRPAEIPCRPTVYAIGFKFALPQRIPPSPLRGSAPGLVEQLVATSRQLSSCAHVEAIPTERSSPSTSTAQNRFRSRGLGCQSRSGAAR